MKTLYVNQKLNFVLMDPTSDFKSALEYFVFDKKTYTVAIFSITNGSKLTKINILHLYV